MGLIICMATMSEVQALQEGANSMQYSIFRTGMLDLYRKKQEEIIGGCRSTTALLVGCTERSDNLRYGSFRALLDS